MSHLTQGISQVAGHAGNAASRCREPNILLKRQDQRMTFWWSTNTCMCTHMNIFTMVPDIPVRDLFPGKTLIYERLLCFPPFSSSVLGEYIQTMCFCLAWHIPSKPSIFHALVKGLPFRRSSTVSLTPSPLIPVCPPGQSKQLFHFWILGMSTGSAWVTRSHYAQTWPKRWQVTSMVFF